MKNKIEIEYERRVKELVEKLDCDFCWRGALSSSPLATATSVFALSCHNPAKFANKIASGLRWIAENANRDGGWGDAPNAISNITATALCFSVLRNSQDSRRFSIQISRAKEWLEKEIGGDIRHLPKAVLKFYGEDKTFSAPILMMLALASPDSAPEAWLEIPTLPYKLALLPRAFYSFLNMGVVSYALPALLAVGWRIQREQMFSMKKMTGRITALINRKTIDLLEKIQPESGGYLEAIPLSAFVLMALSKTEYDDSPAALKAADFLSNSFRNDGSCPIDSDLAIWNTTRAVRALGEQNPIQNNLSEEKLAGIRDWILSCQTSERHQYTGAMPGGWGWTDRPGSVPDADDTAGAIIALKYLSSGDRAILPNIKSGLEWLLNIQNRDGGIPTFCRGWSRLPFDRSCPDISAHALKAFSVWKGNFEVPFEKRLARASEKICAYLLKTQNADGSWTPLWFGSQKSSNRENRVFGTSLVLANLPNEFWNPCHGFYCSIKKAENFLMENQNEDGGWGALKGVFSSVEETAMSLVALSKSISVDMLETPLFEGFSWLAERSRMAREALPASPIGLYFASLWYFEELYPLLFAVHAFSSRVKLKTDGRKKDKNADTRAVLPS